MSSARWPLARISLRARLVAAATGLTAVAIAIFCAAGLTVARGYLVRQADAQLRAYAGRLVGHPFTVSSYSGPALAGLRPGEVRVEVLGPGLRRLLLPGAGSGLPAVSASAARAAWAAAVPGRIAAAPARDGWRLLVAPVHYRAQHVAYVYGAQDVRLLVTSPAQPGAPGTLVVGMDQASLARSVWGPAGSVLVAGVVLLGLLLAASLGLIGVVLRPATSAGSAGPAGPARLLAAAGRDLRRSAGVLRASAGYYRHRVSSAPAAALGGGEVDRLMRTLHDEAARMTAVLDELDRSLGRPPPGGAGPGSES